MSEKNERDLLQEAIGLLVEAKDKIDVQYWSSAYNCMKRSRSKIKQAMTLLHPDGHKEDGE